MAWQRTPYTIPLIVASVISAVAAVYVWRRRHTPASRTGGWTLLAAAVWLTGYALELASANLSAMVFWDKVQFVGICIVPTAWLVYSVQYTGREKWLTRRTLILLSVVPLITLLLVFTNEAHGLIWDHVWLDADGPFRQKGSTYGVALWAYLAYAYLVSLAGIFLLLQALVRSGRVYRWQASALLFTVFTAWLSSVVTDILRTDLFPRLELTPIALSLTLPVVAWSLYRLRQADIVPVARGKVIESISDGVIVLDPELRVVDLNPAAQQIIDRPASAIIGYPLKQVWPHWPGQQEYFHDEAGVGHEVELGRGDAQRIYDVRTSPVTDWRGRPVSWVVVLRDITELKRRTLELSTLLEASRVVSSTLDLEGVLSLIAEQMVKAVQVDGCTLSRWDQENDTVVTWIEQRRLDSEGADKPGTSYALDDFPSTRAVLENRQPLAIRVSDPAADPSEVAHMRKQGAASLLMLPLAIGDRVLGLVELDHGEYERVFTAAEIHLCQALADQAAVAIEQARLHAETQRQLQEQVALREAGAVMSSTLDLEAVLTRIAEQMGRVVDATSAYIWSYEPTTRASTVLAEYFGPQACAGERISDLGATYVEDDDELLETLLAGSYAISHIDDPHLPESEQAHMQQYGARTVLYVPLRIKERLAGCAELWESRQRREYTSEEIVLCQGIAQQAAIALENAQLFEQTQAALREKEVLLQEIHHRVKNNLQIISSLLDLQSDQVEDEQALDMFAESQHRIRSMALIHERLYRSPDLARVDFAEYARDLLTYLFRSYSVGGSVALEVEVEDAALGIDTAIPCGLMLNELVSNALKHAFPEGREGKVYVGLRSNDGQFTLVVRDNGVGFPTDLDFRDTESLGMQLVMTLVEQLEGTIELDRSEGTAFRVTFGELQYKDRS